MLKYVKKKITSLYYVLYLCDIEHRLFILHKTLYWTIDFTVKLVSFNAFTDPRRTKTRVKQKHKLWEIAL